VSILFSDYRKEHPTKAGYFRIGHIVLSTPPTDILTSRVVNNERVTTLRGSNDMLAKTGQARWDFTVQWIAMVDPTQAVDDLHPAGPYQQWDDLLNQVSSRPEHINRLARARWSIRPHPLAPGLSLLSPNHCQP